MKKLFVWMYTHHQNYNTTCALTEDGQMLLNIDHAKDFNGPKLLFSDNAGLRNEYNVQVQNQKKLEEHMYGGKGRDYGVPKDFQVAWDVYRGIINEKAVAN